MSQFAVLDVVSMPAYGPTNSVATGLVTYPLAMLATGGARGVSRSGPCVFAFTPIPLVAYPCLPQP